MSEQWRTIPGVPLFYEVSSFGRVRSWRNKGGIQGSDRWSSEPTLLTLTTSKEGYKRVAFTDGGRQYSTFVHRWVALAFVGEPPSDKHTQVDHLNNVADDNRPENLEWVTPYENSRRRIIHNGHKLHRFPCPSCHAILRLASAGRQNTPDRLVLVDGDV